MIIDKTNITNFIKEKKKKEKDKTNTTTLV